MCDLFSYFNRTLCITLRRKSILVALKDSVFNCPSSFLDSVAMGGGFWPSVSQRLLDVVKQLFWY